MSALVPAGEDAGYRHPDDPGEPSTGAPRLSITDTEGAILSALVNKMRVLEIGTGLGVSATAMAATATSVDTVDIDEWVHKSIWPNLPHNVKGVRAPKGFYGAVFIDGDHNSEPVKSDLRTALAHLEPGGVIIAHDTEARMVRDALLDVVADGWVFIPTTNGIGVLWT